MKRFPRGILVILSDKTGSLPTRFVWARSATKHRISHERSRYVIEHCGLRFVQEPSVGDRSEASARLVFLGDDTEGIALEVMAVELEDESLLVIHAMPLRDRYREQYEEAKKWQR